MRLYKDSWSYKASDDGYAEATDEDVLEHPAAKALLARAEKAEAEAAAWKERAERARRLIEQRTSVHEYAIVAGEEMIAAALSDDPPTTR